MGRGEAEQMDEVDRFGLEGVLPDSERILRKLRAETLDWHTAVWRGSRSQIWLSQTLHGVPLIRDAIKENDPEENVQAFLEQMAMTVIAPKDDNLNTLTRNFFSACGLGYSFSPLLFVDDKTIHLREAVRDEWAICGQETGGTRSVVTRGAFAEADAFQMTACPGCKTALAGYTKSEDLLKAATETVDYPVIDGAEEKAIIEAAAERIRQEVVEQTRLAPDERHDFTLFQEELRQFVNGEIGKLAAKAFLDRSSAHRYRALFSYDSTNSDADTAEVMGRACELVYGHEVEQWPWPSTDELAETFALAAQNRGPGSGTIIRAGTAAHVVARHFPKAIPQFKAWRVDPSKERQEPSIARVLPILEAAATSGQDS